MYRSLLLVVLLLSGCGFHLKGDVFLPQQLQLMQLQQSNDQEFNALLMKQLKAAGVQLTDDESDAFLSVNLMLEPEITVAKSSSTGLEIIRLKLQLGYSLKSNSGKWLAQQKSISQTREFESDSNQLLAKNHEKQQLYQQMKTNLARLLLYQLQLQN